MAASGPGKRLGQAVVIGGGIAGLLAGRVLADHFDHVTLVERDQYPEGVGDRRAVPQGPHVHVLLIRGQEALARLFPGLILSLTEGGAVTVDLCQEIRWYQFGAYKVNFQSRLVGLSQSRPFLEWHIRKRVLALKNLQCLGRCEAKQLLTTSDRRRVTGVRVRHLTTGGEEQLHAALVVDATGRPGASQGWLRPLGYPGPKESFVEAGVGYASRTYRCRSEDLGGAKILLVAAAPPYETRMGAMAAVEGDRWIVSLAGVLGDHPPADERGFLDFARSLPAPDIYNAIKVGQPLTDIRLFKFPRSLWRHYEKQAEFPEGYLILGDALSCFNPMYGQGVTVCALEAEALDRTLRARRRRDGCLPGLAHHFFQQCSKAIATPWRLAACADFRYPDVKGTKPPGTDLMNWYIKQVHHATVFDRKVYADFMSVIHLVRKPSCLFHPDTLLRVLSGRAMGGSPFR